MTYEQEALLCHLQLYSLADYETCLLILQKSDRNKPEYGLRTLRRYRYIARRKDGYYSILQKGLEYLEEDDTALHSSGNTDSRKRLAHVSRVGALLWTNGIPSWSVVPSFEYNVFIPSPVWRKVRVGLTSTVRFAGMLLYNRERLAVYHIGNGEMDWQLYAERSLFFRTYGERETRATGMLLLCDNGQGLPVAEQIIRRTMWRRRSLTGERGNGLYFETDKKQRYSKSPIRLHSQYNQVFLAEEGEIANALHALDTQADTTQCFLQSCPEAVPGRDFWAMERHPDRWVLNPANDLLKYVYLFDGLKAAVKHHSFVRYHLALPEKYAALAGMYGLPLEVVPL